MPWIIGGAAIGGALISADAMGGASGSQEEATRRALAEQRFANDRTRADQAPYRDLGTSAIGTLRRMAGFAPGMDESDPRFKEIYDRIYEAANREHAAAYGMPLSASSDAGGLSGQMDTINRMARQEFQNRFPNAGREAQSSPDFNTLNRGFSIDDFWKDPVTQAGYQAGLEQGTKALRNAAPLTTGMDSGAALKELTKFTTDYTGQRAAESEGRFEGRKSNVFNRLMAMIGGGQVANQVNAASGTNMANNTAGLVTAQGNANAASQIAQGNAFSGALGNISNWWQQQKVLDRMDEWYTPNRTPTTPRRPVMQMDGAYLNTA